MGTPTRMDVFSVALTVVAMLGVAAAILLFERKRARGIEHDLREQATRRAREDQPDDRRDDHPGGPAPG